MRAFNQLVEAQLFVLPTSGSGLDNTNQLVDSNSYTVCMGV